MISVYDQCISSVIYEIAVDVVQTCRDITTRMTEHPIMDSPVGQHLSECFSCHATLIGLLDQGNMPQNLMNLEALHIVQRKPMRNASDEYRSQELTLKC